MNSNAHPSGHETVESSRTASIPRQNSVASARRLQLHLDQMGQRFATSSFSNVRMLICL